MPVSQILPDGRVRIYNNKTGETRDVQANELATYSPRLVGEYEKMRVASQQVTPKQQLENEIAAKKLEEFHQTGVDPAAQQGTSEQMFKKNAATTAVQELERLFGRGDINNVGTGNDLSLANSATFFGKGAAKLNELGKGLFDSKYSEDLNKYKSQRDIALGILTQAFGSGTPQEGEAARLIGSAPGPNATDGEAKQWFASVNKLLGVDTPDVKKNDVVTRPEAGFQSAGTETLNSIQPTAQPEDPQNGNPLTSIAQTIGNAAPVAGGVLGGIGGGIAGLGIGSIPGAAAGTAIGTGAGVALQNMIQDLTGTQDEAPAQQVGDAAKQGVTAGAIDLATGGAFKLVGKGGGLVLKSLSKTADDIPLRSIRANPSQITKFSKKHGEDMGDFMVKNGLLGEDAIENAAQKAKGLQDKFDSFALSNDIQIPVENLVRRFDAEIAELSPAPGRLVPGEYEGLAGKIAAEAKGITDQLVGQTTVTPEMITQLRRRIDDLIPPNQFVDPSVKNIQIRLRRIYNDVVEEAVDSSTGQKSGLKDMGRELSKYYDFLETAEKQEGLGRGNLTLNLTRILSGGTGATVGTMVGGPVGGVVGGTAGLASEALMRNPEVLRAIYQANQVGNRIGPKVGNMTNSALQTLSHLIGAGGAEAIYQK